MMNLVSRYGARDPNVLAFTALESPGETRSESQILLSSWNEQQPITVRLVKDGLDGSKNGRSMIWGMFMSSTLEASVCMGKNYSENLHSIKNTGNNLTLKQMFDISEKLIVGQSDEIYE